jgi:hypothetical protein
LESARREQAGLRFVFPFNYRGIGIGDQGTEKGKGNRAGNREYGIGKKGIAKAR